MEVSEVKEFYKDTNVFITGATGFVGKTLIEKLLRVTEVAAIYILIREKKGKTIEERINQLFENPLFDILKSKRPNYRSKIRTVIGECGSAGLTICDSDKRELESNINIIFHSAATVNFEENLKTAYEINVKGTQTVLDMANKMKKLKAMIYVSTAYSNCNRDQVIEEKVYDYSFENIVAKIEKSTKEDLEGEKVIENWPNTYTFTKAVAEDLVKKKGQNLPIGIFRPSIIVATYKEPIPGWLDNIYALNGISVGVLTGFLRVILSQQDIVIDAVPVDKCVSALMAVPWDISGKTPKNEDIPVYNFISGKENPLTIGYMNYLNFAHGVPSVQAVWYPTTIFVTNEILFWFLCIVLEIIPAMFMDGLGIITGRKARLVSLYRKTINFMVKVKFFALREWNFENRNVQTLWNKLNKVDQDLFPFSMASFSWLFFCKGFILGIRKYILKEDEASIPQAYARYNRFKIVHYTLKATFLYVICHIIYVLFSKIFHTVMS